jgi:thioredoxin reductase (NADPH)
VSAPRRTRVAIIGGGPAGYTAAIYAARGALAPICLEGYDYGGQISRSGDVFNFPGFPGGVPGSDLTAKMREQAIGFGAEIVTTDVDFVDLSGSPFTIVTSGCTYLADTVILATGASARRLGLPTEEQYEGRGVAYCATCDGPLFAGKPVAVVGGGDAAAEEALTLSQVASHVTLVHRRPELRANASLRTALAASPVELVTPYVATEILGDDAGVTRLRLRHVIDGSVRELGVEGLFVSIGHVPASALFETWLELDSHGFVRTQAGTTATSVPGVFAAGDLADPRYRQAVTAAASGCQAAIDAERWLLGHATDLAYTAAANPADAVRRA